MIKEERKSTSYGGAVVVGFITGVIIYSLFSTDTANMIAFTSIFLSALLIIIPANIRFFDTRTAWAGITSGLFLSVFFGLSFFTLENSSIISTAKNAIKMHNIETSAKTKEFIWMERSKDAIREKLKDPSSAQFKNVYFSNVSGTPVTCGEVNSKNGFGAYAGYQLFVAAGSDLAFLQNEVTDFSKLWRELCKK